MFDAIGRVVYDLMRGFSTLMGENPVLTVMVFTLLLRLVMSPFDIVSRKAMQKQTAAQPYIARIQKRYAGNPQVMQKKMSEFNKKHGISILKGCLPMLLTLPLFIIFLNAMNYWANVSNINIFLEAQAGNYDAMIQSGAHDITGTSWLWIRNIWSPDSGLAPVILEPSKFAALPFDNFTHYFTAEQLTAAKLAAENGAAGYSTVMKPVSDYYATTLGVSNGWFILPVLSAGAVLLQSFLTQAKVQTAPGQPGAGSGKFMNIFIALFSGYICLTYNAMFSVYWITSNLCAIALNLVLKKIYPAESYVFEGEAELQ